MKYQSSSEKLSLIIYFYLNIRNFAMMSIVSNKYFFVCYYNQFGNPPHRLVWTIVNLFMTVCKLNLN